MTASPVFRARSRVAVAHRRGNPTEIAEATRDLAAEKLAAYVERVISEAPPLTEEQRDRIALVLRGGRHAS